MTKKFISFCVHHPVSLVSILLAASLWGIFSCFTLEADFVPSLSQRKITISTKYPGLDPLDMEKLVTQPLGFSLNRHTLSGITTALGIVADTAFVMAEFWNQKRWGSQGMTGQRNSFFTQLPSLQISMVVSSFTTIFVFLPLYFLDHIVKGIGDVAITMGLMVVNSLVLGGFFLPVFLEIGGKNRFLLFPQHLHCPVEKFLVNNCVALCETTRKRRITSLVLLCGLSCLPLIFALTAEKKLDTRGFVFFFNRLCGVSHRHSPYRN